MKLLVFGAVWCSPCSRLHDVIEKYIQDHPDVKDRIEFLDIDKDNNADRCVDYGSHSLPTLVLVNDADEFCPAIRTHKGGISAPDFEEFVRNL